MEEGYKTELFDVLLPAVVLLAVLVLLHVLITLVLPLRWPAIRGQFRGQLEERLRADLVAGFAAIPGEVSAALLQERQQVERLRDEVREVADWLDQRQQAASIAGLYGDPQR
jgi:hypothetical protein